MGTLRDARTPGRPAAGRARDRERPSAPRAACSSGPDGVGKTTLALDLAAGLLCLAGSGRTGRAARARPAARSSTAITPICIASRRKAPASRSASARSSRCRRAGPAAARGPLPGGHHREGPAAQRGRPERAAQDARGAAGGRLLILAADDGTACCHTVVSRCARLRLGPCAADDRRVAGRARRRRRRARRSAGPPDRRPAGCGPRAGRATGCGLAQGRLSRTLLDLWRRTGAGAWPRRRS